MYSDNFIYLLNELYENKLNNYKKYRKGINDNNKLYNKSVDLLYDSLDTILEIFDLGDFNNEW